MWLLFAVALYVLIRDDVLPRRRQRWETPEVEPEPEVPPKISAPAYAVAAVEEAAEAPEPVPAECAPEEAVEVAILLTEDQTSAAVFAYPVEHERQDAPAEMLLAVLELQGERLLARERLGGAQ